MAITDHLVGLPQPSGPGPNTTPYLRPPLVPFPSSPPIPPPGGGQSSVLGSVLSWMGASAPGPGRDLSSGISTLQQEVTSLESLSRSVFFELQDLTKERDRATESKSWRGSFNNLVGMAVGGYCIYRIIYAIVMLGVPSLSAASDPVGQWASFLLRSISGGHLVINERAFAQVITLAFVGIISGSSLRSLLLDLLRFFSALSSAGNSGTLLLVFSYVMGLYFLSSVVLIRQR